MPISSYKNQARNGLIWTFLNHFSNYSMQFVVGIIMARLLSPDDFGTVALPVVFISIANILIEGSFESALIRKTSVSEQDLATSFFYSLTLSVLLYILFFFISPIIAQFYNKPVLTQLIRVSTIIFLLKPFVIPQNAILLRNLSFKTTARISIVNKIASAVIGVVTAYLGFEMWALVFANIASSFIEFIQICFIVRWIPKEKFSKESFKYLWSYGNKMIGVNLINCLFANIIPIFLGKIGGTFNLGLYDKAKAFASIPSSNFASVIIYVFFPIFSKVQNEKNELAIAYRKVIRISSYITFPIMLGMCVLANPLIITLITEKWAPCIILLKIMCFTYMFQPMQSLNLTLLQVLGRTDLFLKIEFIKKIIGAVIIIFAIPFGLKAVCIADFGFTMFALVCNTYYTGKLINVGYMRQILDVLPSFLLSCFMALCIFIITLCVENMIVQIILGFVIGVLIYIIASYLLKFSELDELIQFIHTRKNSSSD